MTPEEKYTYDVFISYSHNDLPWAERLFKDLEQRRFNVFFDKTRLEAGVEWEGQLEDALTTSQHLVVLWSEGNIKPSSWVHRELGHFRAAIRLSNKSAEKPRRMICLPLEGEQPAAYGSFQMVNDLYEARAYDSSVNEVDVNLWQGVLSKIEQAITSKGTLDPMPLAVLTMTEDQVENLDLAAAPRFAQPLGEFLGAIGIKNKGELKQHYGPRRTDWQPFGRKQKILPMMEKLSVDINRALRGEDLEDKQFHWDPIDEEQFWGDDRHAYSKQVDKLKDDPLSVVVVDPIALYEGEVREALEQLSAMLKTSRVLFMTLMPWQCLGVHSGVRSLMELSANLVYSHLYEPTFVQYMTQANWHCDLSIGDEADIQRALLPPLRMHHIDKPRPAATQM